MTLQINDAIRLNGVSLSDVKPAPRPVTSGFYAAFGKRALDVSLVLLALPFLLPVLAILAFFIALEGVNPFYLQKRLGRDGRVFHMLKFRSMVHNADRALSAYLDANPAAKLEWDHSQKLKKDPRITRVGRLLRKCSLDELPQFWNVLIGDMSLVGPRPMMVDQANLYPGRSYYWMRPGISGLWQVTDRNETAFTERAVYDDKYFHNQSFKMDLGILMKTFVVVFRGTGY